MGYGGSQVVSMGYGHSPISITYGKGRVSNGIFESSPIALKTSLGERENSQLFKMPKIFKIGSRSSEIGPFEISRFVSKIP